MGNCKGKLSKESKNQMRGEAYTRPSKPDTQEKETIHVEGKQVIKNDNNKDAVVINAKIQFVNPETPTKSESVMQGPNTSVSDTNGLKASGSTGKQDKKQHESDAIPQKCVEKQNKDVLSSVNIKNNIGEETNLKEAPQIDISLNKVPGSKSDDAEDDHSYLFAAGRKDEEPQIETSEFIDKKTGKSDDSAHKGVVISSNAASPTDKATKETSPITKVDDLQTDNTGGNDSESVKGGSDQTKGIENNPDSKPSDKPQPDNGPSDNQQSRKPSDKPQPENAASDNQQSSKPSDKPQPENAASDNQQSNEDPTGYEGSKFSKPGDKQDREISEEMKSGKEKEKKKKKKKKRDKYDGPPANTVIHHYYGHAETVNIGNDNINYYGGKEEPKIEKADPVRPTAIHSVETMNILSDVAKSVGYIIGPKESGTCWRVGNDKIITAAHVVVDNIWNQLIKSFLERDLNKFRVDFEYINKESSNHDQFKVVPSVLFMDESLDVAVLQLKPDEKKPFPPPLKMSHVLNREKHDDKQIYLISHNQSKKKEVNSGIGIWKPTEKKLQDLEKFCQQYEEENGYLGLERKDRLVIQCDFEGGASGSPGFVILNSVAYVILVYIRGFPSFYHSQKFSKERRRKFPTDKLFQHGVNIENLFVAMSNGVDNILLRNEIFPEEALILEQTMNQHKLAVSGDKTSSNTETSSEIVKGKIDNSTGTACTDQSEDNIPDAANYSRLMSHHSVPGQTFITSPQEDTDRYKITGNQSAQDIKTGESDKCTVQDQGSHSHSITGNAAAENHNLHAKDGEMITLQRSPGNTRPMSAGQISIDEWIGNAWQDHRYKQLQDNNLLLLSKAIHPECVNSVAIHFNLNQMDVEVIQTGQQTYLCYQMLYKWKNKNGEEATLGKLIQNLFSSWISENKSVEKEVLISAISQVTMVSNEKAAS